MWKLNKIEDIELQICTKKIQGISDVKATTNNTLEFNALYEF